MSADEFVQTTDDMTRLFELVLFIGSAATFAVTEAYSESSQVCGDDGLDCCHDLDPKACRGMLNQPRVECDVEEEYRTYDGTCNNLDNPARGSATSCFLRLLPAYYEDDFSSMRVSVTGDDLPIPRNVSLRAHHRTDELDRRRTSIFVVFGQFVSHDVNLTPFARNSPDLLSISGRNFKNIEIEANLLLSRPLSEPTRDASGDLLDCCGDDRDHPLCGVIEVGGDGDPFYQSRNITCINAARSFHCQACLRRPGPVHQINAVTSYLDGSVMYGSSKEEVDSIRKFEDGKLETFKKADGSELLPQDFENLDNCQRPGSSPCFKAGDARVNQHSFLTVMHTIWVLFHNFVAEQLADVHPEWTDDVMFEEVRRIVGAVLQQVTYREYLPELIGGRLMRKFELRTGARSSYNRNIWAMVTSEFSTAAYRVGHSLIPTDFGADILRNAFFNPTPLYNNSVGSLVTDMSGARCERFDPHLVTDVTEFLYSRGSAGGDLAAFNVFRGRDHGLRPYVDYLKLCTCREVSDFSQLRDVMTSESVDILQELYSDVRDIDLFTGGTSELPLQGAATGPTFGCIIASQFWTLKYGDRFYFEHGNQVGSFSDGQLREISKMSLSKIVCHVLEVQSIPFNLMVTNSRRVSCQTLKDNSMDFTAF